MRANTMTPAAFDVEEASALFADSEEHRGWTVVVAVRRAPDGYCPEIFVRSPGSVSGTCIPHGGRYVSEGQAREAGLAIGCRWIDCHGLED
jgi:hypothetical protein